MKTIVSTNPGHNYEVVGEMEASSKSEIKDKVKLANGAKESWSNLTTFNRVNYIKRAFVKFKENAETISQLITKEIGTPITECRDEVEWDWSYFEWFLNNAESALADETLYEDAQTIHKIIYEPTGSVAVVTPWNLPFDMFLWGVIPNLLAGNTVVYKAAEECILSGRLYGEIMSSIGLPPGVFNIVHGDAEEGKYLLNQELNMIWFTGSSSVGREVFKLSGKKFIRSILEMGGSNPAIIFEDAPISDSLLNSILFKRFSFCGQTCDADKRLIIHKAKYNEFIEKFIPKVESLLLGLPEDSKTQIGPLVSQKQLNLLKSQVEDAINHGGKVLTGGRESINLKGSYYPPTVITGVKTQMRIWKEEVFGPVLPIITFETEAEAIQLANDTNYGLGSQIYTTDMDRAARVASRLQSGNVDVNACGHFKPFIPFGGYKDSGMGREHGVHGFRELCQMKTFSFNKYL